MAISAPSIINVQDFMNKRHAKKEDMVLGKEIFTFRTTPNGLILYSLGIIEEIEFLYSMPVPVQEQRFTNSTRYDIVKYHTNLNGSRISTRSDCGNFIYVNKEFSEGVK